MSAALVPLYSGYDNSLQRIAAFRREVLGGFGRPSRHSIARKAFKAASPTAVNPQAGSRAPRWASIWGNGVYGEWLEAWVAANSAAQATQRGATTRGTAHRPPGHAGPRLGSNAWASADSESVSPGRDALRMRSEKSSRLSRAARRDDAGVFFALIVLAATGVPPSRTTSRASGAV